MEFQEMRKKINKQTGYTIIETMIAVSLFIVIVMSGMGALLNANLLHQKSQNMRSIMDNLSFIMEDMSRSIRTGDTYHCLTGAVTGTTYNQSVLDTPLSCSIGWGIAFKNAIDGATWVYKIEAPGAGEPFNIYKSFDAGVNWVQLNPDEVVVNSMSGFSVLGAEPPAGDQQQPLVNMSLFGSITYQTVDTPFSLQTSMSQRLIDVAI